MRLPTGRKSLSEPDSYVELSALTPSTVAPDLVPTTEASCHYHVAGQEDTTSHVSSRENASPSTVPSTGAYPQTEIILRLLGSYAHVFCRLVAGTTLRRIGAMLAVITPIAHVP